MIATGQVYKFIGPRGLIKPDEWGQNRHDVLFNKIEHQLVLGDRVEYEPVDRNGRKFAEKLRKIEKSS